jgi:hypothetical protein
MSTGLLSVRPNGAWVTCPSTTSPSSLQGSALTPGVRQGPEATEGLIFFRSENITVSRTRRTSSNQVATGLQLRRRRWYEEPMKHVRKGLRAVLSAVTLAGLCTLALEQSAEATPTTTLGLPSNVPLPVILPSGKAPASSTLQSMSCLSPASCVAVGSVSDEAYNTYPLIETLSDGSWSPSVGPEPSTAGTPGHGHTIAAGLTFVSCATDDACAFAAHRKSRFSLTEIRADSVLRLRG